MSEKKDMNVLVEENAPDESIAPAEVLDLDETVCSPEFPNGCIDPETDDAE